MTPLLSQSNRGWSATVSVGWWLSRVVVVSSKAYAATLVGRINETMAFSDARHYGGPVADTPDDFDATHVTVIGPHDDYVSVSRWGPGAGARDRGRGRGRGVCHGQDVKTEWCTGLLYLLHLFCMILITVIKYCFSYHVFPGVVR